MPIPPLPVDSYDKKLAIDYLASCLFDGALALVFGAGISKSLGFPNWNQLVIRCGKIANIDTSSIDENSNEHELCMFMDKIERKLEKKEYFKVVHTALYGNVNDFEYNKNIISKDLLISIGALIMGSRRGSAKEVVTFNFDNALEKYLEIHGYVSQIVYNLP